MLIHTFKIFQIEIYKYEYKIYNRVSFTSELRMRMVKNNVQTSGKKALQAPFLSLVWIILFQIIDGTKENI